MPPLDTWQLSTSIIWQFYSGFYVNCIVILVTLKINQPFKYPSQHMLVETWHTDDEYRPRLHHCQIIHDQYLQSQTPTISKHSLTTYISFTVSGQTQSNKLVYWETRICWNIENIFWSDQWPSTNKLWKTNKNLRVICRKSRRSLMRASSSGPSTRMTSSTGEDTE